MPSNTRKYQNIFIGNTLINNGIFRFRKNELTTNCEEVHILHIKIYRKLIFVEKKVKN